jgi:hypothetical protein
MRYIKWVLAIFGVALSLGCVNININITPPTPMFTVTPTQPITHNVPQTTGYYFWNLAADMRVSPQQENPNRDSYGNLEVWHFMQSADLHRQPTSYTLLPNFYADADHISGLQAWMGDETENGYHVSSPIVAINTTDTIQHPSGTVTFLPHTVNFHPAPYRLVIVGWRSPIEGTVKITGSMSDMDNQCGDGIGWYIDQNSTNLVTGNLANGATQNFLSVGTGSPLKNITITKGDFIYFIIHPKGDYICDSTRLDVSIETVE